MGQDTAVILRDSNDEEAEAMVPREPGWAETAPLQERGLVASPPPAVQQSTSVFSSFFPSLCTFLYLLRQFGCPPT